MVPSFSSLRAKSLALLVVVLLLALSACTGIGNNSSGSNSNGSKSNVSSTSGSNSHGAKPNASINITVGEGQSTEEQLLATMYALVLHHASFKVVAVPALSSDTALFNAITSGHIDLYPEYTTTGLIKLGLFSTGVAQQDYLQVKQGYEARYKITWLDISPLNDTYGICSTQTTARSLGVSKISDLSKKATNLTIAVTPDGLQHGINLVKSVYHLTFKKVATYSSEEQTFSAVNSGAQDLNICTTTSADIANDKLVLLQDDKNAFPVYNPAPIVRNSLLKQVPQVAIILNRLAPYLTTQVSQQLQSEVLNDGKSVTEVATQFLQSKGLL
ncbi:MAG TPA: glycine betaine ABC transporter substrate-binding protein [Ktedonobacteraceae bacterium]|nr:glycine betaine ABC transporter substrate-binding protein [Ktedonobacteraceae bacterium]